MTIDETNEPVRSTRPGPWLPVQSDWRGWLSWAATQNWADPDNWRQFLAPWAVAPSPVATREIEVTWRSLAEADPGAAFAQHWGRIGPALERWWLSDGRSADQDSASQARTQLRRHMPELEPVWDSLVELAGGGPLAATVLALWNPPAFLTGCSQLVVPVGGPALIRNYDWDYRLFDATVANTGYLGRRVLGTEDCGWGLLDGVNDVGLAMSLTFGGRPEVGEGFGIPLVLRYVLQTCATVDEAAEALLRIPVHMAYNITLTDRSRRVATVHVGPGRPAWVTDAGATTNHQQVVEWRPYCDAIHSERRLELLDELLEASTDVAEVTTAMLREPLYATQFQGGFGTLYTAVTRPDERTITYHWPDREPWTHTLDQPRTDEVVVVLDRSGDTPTPE